MRLDSLSVIGGGWSAGQVDLARAPGPVIAVNDAALHAPRVDFVVSMDRLWIENRRDWLVQQAKPTWLRRGAAKSLAEDWPGLVRFDCDHTATEFAADPETLNGTNSGFCALNLAWGMRPRRLYLFGFDMGRSPGGQAYFFPAYPWAKPQGNTSSGRYSEWAAQLAAAARQFKAAGIDVLNVSASKAVTAFPRIAPRQSEFAA